MALFCSQNTQKWLAVVSLIFILLVFHLENLQVAVAIQFEVGTQDFQQTISEVSFLVSYPVWPHIRANRSVEADGLIHKSPPLYALIYLISP